MKCKQCSTEFCYGCGREWFQRGNNDNDDPENRTSRCDSSTCFYTDAIWEGEEDEDEDY